MAAMSRPAPEPPREPTSPFAYGAALAVSPLILLLTALLGASFGGVIGVALAAPLTAIAMHSVRLLRAPLPPVGTDAVPGPPAPALANATPDGDPA
jgi:hypothetical protein